MPQDEKLLKMGLPTWLNAGQEGLQSWVAVLVVVLGQVGPEGLDGGPTLLQEPGKQGVHGLVDPLSALLLQGILWVVITNFYDNNTF